MSPTSICPPLHHCGGEEFCPLIEIVDLVAGYDHRPVREEVNLKVFPGEFLGIIGPNGGGKTTLIKSILGLIAPIRGKIIFRDRRGDCVSHLSVGYLPQRKNIDALFPISVEEVVISGLMSELGWLGRPSAAQRRRVSEVLEMVGMASYRQSPIGTLSGGQMQRTMLARAIVGSPSLLVLDEPNSYLDMEFSDQLIQILQRLNASGTTILMVSHEVASLSGIVGRVVSVEKTLKEGSLECPYHHSVHKM